MQFFGKKVVRVFVSAGNSYFCSGFIDFMNKRGRRGYCFIRNSLGVYPVFFLNKVEK